MSDQLNADWSDERIVGYIRHWAIEHGKCGLDSYSADRINRRYVFPAGKILADRGPGSLAKLLPLLDDIDPDVRLMAAGIAYDADKDACRRTLEELMKSSGIVRILAWATLSHKEGPGTIPYPSMSRDSEG
jgi:hypothetical protein